MSGEDLNKASVTYCTDLQEIADVLMKHHDCHTVAADSNSTVVPGPFALLNTGQVFLVTPCF